MMLSHSMASCSKAGIMGSRTWGICDLSRTSEKSPSILLIMHPQGQSGLVRGLQVLAILLQTGISMNHYAVRYL